MRQIIFFRYLFGAVFTASLCLFISSSLAVAMPMQEHFILPLAASAGINTYFDLDPDNYSIKDAGGYNCSIDITQVTDENGDDVVNIKDYDSAMGRECPWKLGQAYNRHAGTDFQAHTGTDVLAAAAGKVISVTSSWKNNEYGKKSYGNLIIIEQADGSQTYYGHLEASGVIEMGLKVGDQVSRGDKIATSDNNGTSKGAHLHFEIHDKDKNPVDPFSNNLWATDGTKNITTIDHILTAKEYGAEQNKTIVLPPVKADKKPASPPLSIWQKAFNFFKNLFKPSAPGIGGGVADTVLPLNTDETGKIMKLKSSATDKKTFTTFVPSTGVITVPAKDAKLSGNIKLTAKTLAGATGKNTVIGLNNKQAREVTASARPASNKLPGQFVTNKDAPIAKSDWKILGGAALFVLGVAALVAIVAYPAVSGSRFLANLLPLNKGGKKK